MSHRSVCAYCLWQSSKVFRLAFQQLTADWTKIQICYIYQIYYSKLFIQRLGYIVTPIHLVVKVPKVEQVWSWPYFQYYSFSLLPTLFRIVKTFGSTIQFHCCFLYVTRFLLLWYQLLFQWFTEKPVYWHTLQTWIERARVISYFCFLPASCCHSYYSRARSFQ